MPATPSKSARSAADVIASECIGVRVRLLNRTISGIFDDALRPLGLTAGQINLLVLISKRAPVAPGEVARRFKMEKSTVSRNIERMRASGWIKVEAGSGGNSQLLSPTAKGARLLEEALPYWQEAQERAASVLGERGAKSIHRIGNSLLAEAAGD
jgi:DNA-binding MarR family transcriptional regulator